MTPADEISDEITARLAEKKRAAAERKAQRRRQRAEMAERRNAGLERRHARKLARTEQTTSQRVSTGTDTLSPAGSPAENARGRASGAERKRPVVTSPLGSLLADTRTARGLSARGLGLSVGAAHSTVRRIERAERRVSPAMLRSLAAALTDDDAAAEALTARLIAAAGEQLVDDTPAGMRRRARRERRARRARVAREVAEHNRRADMQRQGYALAAQAHRLMDRPGALDDAATLEQVNLLLDQSQRLIDEAGPYFYAGALGPMVDYMRASRRQERRAEQRRTRTRTPRPLVEPSPDAPWPKVERYLKERRRRELGIDYDA